MKKLALILLLALLLLIGCACAPSTGKNEDTTPSAEIPDPPAAEKVTILPKGKRASFRLIYGADSDPVISFAALLIRDAAEKTMWSTLNARDDAKEPEANEILLGATNRPESAEALRGLADNEYIIFFDGEKLIINAPDSYGVKCAARRFLDECFTEGTDLVLAVGYTLKGTYEVPASVPILNGLKHGMNVECNNYDRAAERTPETFRMLAESGFDHVRIPVTVPAFLDEDLLLDDEKMQAVDHVLDDALDAGLVAILDLHYWEVMFETEPADPDAVALFDSMWRQLAERYKDRPKQLCYELINEPHMKDKNAWNEIQMQVYRTVRSIDAERIVFFSSNNNDALALADLVLPEDDDWIALDVHDYYPIQFTHQGVLDSFTEYVPYSQNVLATFTATIDTALAFRSKTGIPMILGEFSVSPHLATDEDVSSFLSDVTAYMEQHHLPWTYWELDHYWAIYDGKTGAWKEPRFGGLMGDHKTFVK